MMSSFSVLLYLYDIGQYQHQNSDLHSPVSTEFSLLQEILAEINCLHFSHFLLNSVYSAKTFFLLQYDGIIVIWALSEQQNFSSLLLNFFQILFKIFLCIKISKYSTCSSIHSKHVCYLYLLCLDKVGNIKMWSWPYSDVIKTNRLFSYVIKWNLRSWRLHIFCRPFNNIVFAFIKKLQQF